GHRPGGLCGGDAGVPVAHRAHTARASRSPRTAPTSRPRRYEGRGGECGLRGYVRRAQALGALAVIREPAPENLSKPHLSLCLRVLSRRRTRPGKTLQCLFPDAVKVTRSVCLRVSGAVAPSAPASKPISPSVTALNR